MKMNPKHLKLVDTGEHYATKEGARARDFAAGKGVAFLRRKRLRRALLTAGCCLGFALGFSLVFFSPCIVEYFK